MQYPNDNFAANYSLLLTANNGDYSFSICRESSDSFTYSYDGCDVNPALKPPKDNHWQGGGWASDITDYITAAWDPVDGAVGYIVHFTCEAGNWNADTYDYTYYNFLNHLWGSWNGSPDGAWCLEICSVDKNGDRSAWSEPLYFTVTNGKVDNALNYAYLNNIDSEGNLLLTEAEGAVRYTVSVTGNGADLSFESETPVIEGFSAALKDYPDGEYTLVISANNNIGICRWLVTSFNKQDEGFFNEENEIDSAVERAPEAAEIPETDKITSIKINPAFNMKNKHDTSAELDLTKIKIKAKEIYDKARLKRAEEALGAEIIGNKHYNLLDLILLYNDQDFSNGYDGLVQVIIPLPKGHRDKTFSCYRLVEVNGKLTKEVIPGEQTEDSYIIYLEHFSEYALVADGGETGETPADPDVKPETPADPDDKPNTPAPTPGGNPSIGRPVTRPTASTGTTSTESTDNSTEPADPKDEDAEEPEPDETDEEGDVDADTDENDDEEDEDDEDNEPEDDGYDDTFSKDDTDGNDAEEDSPIVTPEAIARDENPGTGVPVNAAMIFGFLMAGTAAYAAFGKDKAARKK